MGPHVGAVAVIAVAICAYTEERWDWICEALQSLRRQTLEPAEVLLVIDHNAPLLQRAQSAFPDVSVIPNEGEQGLSGGKNTALAHTTAELIAFLDDDATAAPDWLASLAGHFGQPDVVGTGSRVTPRWEQEPDWLVPEFWWTVGCSHEGLPQEVTPVRNTFGGASMVRAQAAREAGGFRTDLGRAAGNLGGGEETEFCIRLAQVGRGHLLYDPTTTIFHRVPADRCTWRYFVRRCYGEGRSKALVSKHAGAGAGLESERSFVWHTLPRAARRELRVLLSAKPRGALGLVCLGLGLSTTTAGFAWGWALGLVGKDAL